ncbi:hypothetical protein [Pseudoalteromonas maricaloris]|uniref:hypothetical protein n=1 Tax=Pseudoalteromonas maricaloris TaxID=184924 RepID=UPI003C16C88A
MQENTPNKNHDRNEDEDSTSTATSAPTYALEETDNASSVMWWSTSNAMTMSTCVLVFSILTIVVYIKFFSTDNDKEKLSDNFIVILVILLSVFIVVAGYDKDQITPLIGLFGTIVGYILGKRSNSKT